MPPIDQALLDLIVPVLPYLVLALLPGMFLWAYLSVRGRERRRRRHLERFAAEQGFRFESEPAAAIHEQFERRGGVERFKPFDSGWYRRSSNAISGSRGGVDWQIFDYHCRFRPSDGGHSIEDYTIIAATLPVQLPRTTIRAQGYLDRVVAAAGFPDVEIGDDRFDRGFRIESEDPGFARTLLHPEARRFLTNARHQHWQLGPPGIMLFLKGHQRSDRILAAMQEIEAFVRFIPTDLRSTR